MPSQNKELQKISRRDFLKLVSLLPMIQFEGYRNPISERYSSPKHKTREKLPNIIIILFDTLSAYHMSLYGYRRKTTPNIASLAKRGTVYHRHYAAGNFTTPGTASLLTGSYPWSHRGFHLHGLVSNAFANNNIFYLLKNHYYTFAYTHNHFALSLLHQFRSNINELLKISTITSKGELLAEKFFWEDFNKADWSEIILRGANNLPPASLNLIIIQRFFSFLNSLTYNKTKTDLFPRGIPHTHTNHYFTMEKTNVRIADALKNLPRPFLGYFHLWPPHDPYTTRRDFVDIFDDGWVPPSKTIHSFSHGKSAEILSENRRLYDEYIAYVDAEFGRLFKQLDQNGFLEDAYLILTSDHGELFERGILGHITQTLYEPIIHIPLIIFKPGQLHREDITIPTSCIDLLPTLLNIANLPMPTWVEGTVLPTFDTQKTISDRSIFAVEAKSNPKRGSLKKATIAMIKGQYKIINYLGYDSYDGEYELYDLKNDPEELNNIYISKPFVASGLRSELDKKLFSINQT